MDKLCVAILLAGGKSVRTGLKTPKQLLKVAQKTLLELCIEQFQNTKKFEHIVVVFNFEYEQQIKSICTQYGSKIMFVEGAKTRQHSVYHALCALEKADDAPHNAKILIHDVSRPFVTQNIIVNVLEALDNHDAVDIGIPVTDTIKHLEEGIIKPLMRDKLYATQTPQGFSFTNILKAHHSAYNANRLDYTDDITLYMDYISKRVGYVMGNKSNKKVTFSEDLRSIQQNFSIKVGHGFDVHKFDNEESPNNKAAIRICGIDVLCDRKIIAHSDGDVGIHAIVDSIFGALALGDIGDHFPPSDPKWKDTDSINFLQYAKQKCLDANAKISNIDVTIICEKPRVSEYKKQMANKIAKILDITENAVNIKATTTERLGFLGRGEGLAATACCLLQQY